MGTRKPRYQVIFSSSLNSVIDETNLRVRQNYVPKGGIINFDGIFYQAVFMENVKYRKREPKIKLTHERDIQPMQDFGKGEYMDHSNNDGAPF